MLDKTGLVEIKCIHFLSRIGNSNGIWRVSAILFRPYYGVLASRPVARLISRHPLPCLAGTMNLLVVCYQSCMFSPSLQSPFVRLPKSTETSLQISLVLWGHHYRQSWEVTLFLQLYSWLHYCKTAWSISLCASELIFWGFFCLQLHTIQMRIYILFTYSRWVNIHFKVE